MPVKIFVPRIPTNEEEFINYIKKLCNPANIRISKNKDGSSYCIILLNYNENVICANDIIKELNGKVIEDVVLKPRIYVDQSLLCKLSSYAVNLKEMQDDVVNTTHFFNGFYYVQLLSEKDSNMIMTSLLKELYDKYKTEVISALSYDDLVLNKLYATFYNDDQQFYRIKLLEKINSQEVKVSFIDFGNDEIVNSEKICPISDQLSQFPPMVHKCVITGLRILNYKRQELVAREILHRNYRAKLVKEKDENLNMDRVVSLDYLDFTSITYRNYLIIEDIAEDIQSNGYKENNSNPENNHCHNTLGIQNGFKEEESSVILTHFESLDEFYVQPINKATDYALFNLKNMISKFVDNLSDDMQYIGPDKMYVSQFSLDENWYRCQVIDDRFDDSSEPHCIVHFVDYGNSEKKYNPADLKPVTDKSPPGLDRLITLPFCAKKCRFSDDLVYALSKAKMEKEYFQQNFVQCEKAVTFMYYYDRSNKVWIVDNIRMADDEEIMSIVLKQCENTEKTDIYRLSNLEYLDKIWFILVKSIDPTVQDQLSILDKWRVDQQVKKLEPTRKVIHNKIYCAKLHNGSLVRCRVLGKNMHNVMIHDLDSGLADTVSIESVFHLDESLKCIPPMARPMKLVLNGICADEHQIEEKIVQIIGNSNVELDMVNENCIRDVIIKEKSLVKCLAQLDYIQTNSTPKTAIKTEPVDVSDLPECLLPRTDEESGDIDFSIPNVEKMEEIPLEIAILNSKVRSMRTLFRSETGNIFYQLSIVTRNCAKLNSLIELCHEVDDLSQSIEVLSGEFVSLSCNIKTKLRDFDPLILRRTTLCQKVCALHSDLGAMLLQLPCDKLELLLTSIETMMTSVENLRAIFGISSEQIVSAEIDIAGIQNKIADFQQSELHTKLVESFEQYAQITDEVVLRYQHTMRVMFKEYEFGEQLFGIQNTTVPLTSSTFELYSVLREESDHFLSLLNSEDVRTTFDVVSVVYNYYMYLQQQKSALDTIVVKTNILDSLNDYATSILNDDTAIFQKIEENHKKIISFRSTLKHNVADMEDAEEQDERDKIIEISCKIDETRKLLHETLKSSKDIIDDSVRRLMLRKPELQLKNQSIFFCDKGIPVYLWDSIFFNIPNDPISDFFHTTFGDEVVNMKKLSLNTENYKSVLHNLTTYSSQVTDGEHTLVSLLPINYAFLSRSEMTTVYMIVKDYEGIHHVPEKFQSSLVSIVNLFKAAIDQIVNLWHIGFTFSNSDLENGLFVIDHSVGNGLHLPLPLTSILTRENISHVSESIQVYLSKLGELLQDCIARCQVTYSFNIGESSLQCLVSNIQHCKGVAEAEKIFEDLDQFLGKYISDPISSNQIEESSDAELSNDNASSIEQVDNKEYEDVVVASGDNLNGIHDVSTTVDLGIDNEDEVDTDMEESMLNKSDSTADEHLHSSFMLHDVSVTEQVLEEYSEVE